MPSSASSAGTPWTRRMRYSDQDLRVSDAERNAVAERLSEHYADGRLDQAEFDQRIGQAMAAKTRGDLIGLFDDLPGPWPMSAFGSPSGGAGGASAFGAASGPASGAASGPGDFGGPGLPFRTRRRHGPGRSLVMLVLAVIAVSFVWHAVVSLAFPWFSLLAVAGIVFFVSRSSRRR